MAGNTNEQKIKELEQLSQQMDSFYKQGKLKERNMLVERRRELRRTIDYGYREGQEVEYLKYKRKWEKAKIKTIDENWQVEIDNRSIPVELIRPVSEQEQDDNIYV